MDAWREWLRPELIWFFLGLVLLFIELVVPGLVVAFFAFGAWVVAVVHLFTPKLPGKVELHGTQWLAAADADIPEGSLVEVTDKNILPPQSIKDAMEKQMRAEREKRASIAESEGDRQAKINRAEGERQEMIARSEGEKQRRINEAEGRAVEIQRVAEATAEGIRKIAAAISDRGGAEAVNLRIAEQYLQEFGKLAKTNNSMIIPSDLADVAGVIQMASSVIRPRPEVPSPVDGRPKAGA